MAAGKSFERRFRVLGQDTTCASCGLCRSGKVCESARVDEPRKYGGIRLTSDGFDCALPVTIDSHSRCTFGCAYCFSEQLVGHVDTSSRDIGQTSLRQIERIFAGEGGKFGAVVRKALRYDKKSPYPCPVQLGGINDPCDNIERQQGWLKEFIRLAIKYNQPVRLSTKGVLLAETDYLKVLEEAPYLFWVTFSIITPDDDLNKLVEPFAPVPSERLKTIKTLSDLGCKTAIRFRPIFPGLADRTPRYPRAYRYLIESLAEAGGSAVSAETGFVPTGFTKHQRRKWDKMEHDIGVPLKHVYRQLGKSQVCFRPSHVWTENIMHAIAEVTTACGMTLGVSDPVWKQLTQAGCCCGILPDDPVFGNWEPENATNALLLAKIAKERGEEVIIHAKDIIPAWAYEVLQSQMCNMGAGPKVVYDKRHKTWADKLQEIWDNPASQRSPLNYFQGAWEPVRLEGGEMGYRYVGLKRQHRKNVPYWIVSK